MVNNLKNLRSEYGISQAYLAKAVGTTQQSIAHYECGDVNPGLPMLIRLADYFHTSIDYLIGRTNVDRPVENYRESDLDHDEMSVMEDYRRMDDLSKYVFRNTIRLMEENNMVSQQKKTKKKK